MHIGSTAIADIISAQWQSIIDESRFNSYQLRTLSAIRYCRTPALGGYRYRCDGCSKIHQVYHSCRNRHCPRCQNTQREEWVTQQERRLVGNEFYHIVFTVPAEVQELFMTYPRQLYSALMRIGWSVINDFGWNHKWLGAQTGATIVVHTWGSNLSYHPHIHCIVPGGGVTLRNKWRKAKGKGKYLFCVKQMSKVFRARMILAVRHMMEAHGMVLSEQFIKVLQKKPWVVYCKPPFGGKQGVVRYLARYTHKVAITHHRIKHYDKHRVTFKYTDYRHANRPKIMSLHPSEFVRRLTMHFLPKGFCRIRHYGILSGTWAKRFNRVRFDQPNIDWVNYWLEKGLDVMLCPHCQKGRLNYDGAIDPVRGPPEDRSCYNKSQHP